jgi:hypothetical protein
MPKIRINFEHYTPEGKYCYRYQDDVHCEYLRSRVGASPSYCDLLKTTLTVEIVDNGVDRCSVKAPLCLASEVSEIETMQVEMDLREEGRRIKLRG